MKNEMKEAGHLLRVLISLHDTESCVRSFNAVFIKLWSAENQWSAADGLVVCGGPQAVLEERFCKSFIIEEMKNTPYTSVLKLPLLVDLQQKVGELILSLTSYPTIIIL
jgi:hypothetical protein